ncbi:MAG: aldehyde-activating protein [Alphaproteobacteria bacterium HGW-Alphaproteobacteria-11]|nr:MAG: aldehyde-activating protein [Alphaproteobacteria bacterium HGW-Alphaproteobacteria-11]
MIEGSCLCGAVRFRAMRMSGIVVCHCSMCRKAAGGAAGAFFVARRDEVTWEGAEHLASYKSSPTLERSFCSRCGTAMTGANLIEPDETIILAANALDGDIAARIVAHEHVGSKTSWADNDDAPHFRGPYPGWESLRP